ncbi:MAG TPA: dipeptidase [Chthoniobacterales bacterium]|nr:dipeptidase [Chthoniobacterales bacterium]
MSLTATKSQAQTKARAFATASADRFLSELIRFVRFPSVSAQPQHADDVKRCAAWLARHLQSIGLENVTVTPTARHPIVCANWRHARGQPTVLLYGHYDVQPVDPLSEWRSPPFDPVVRGENLFGRGASDDKGQLFAHLKALESCLRGAGGLPVNVVCLFEGEEEIGSTNLARFLTGARDDLAADVAVISDTRMLGANRPAITYGLRGALSMELEVRGPGTDLHSGNFGGAIHNPLQALCEMLAELHGADQRVTIPGFYDRVRNISRNERAYMARHGPSDREVIEDAQAGKGWGEPGLTLYERIAVRPALTINGLGGGYQGPGAKAVIPSRATAKLNFRLVPDQDPKEIEQLFRAFMVKIAPPAVRVAVRAQAGAKPAVIDPKHPAIRAAARAYRAGFGASPVLLRSGGTIPVVSMFQESLGIPTILMGFALPDDSLHGPNEKFHLPVFRKAIRTSIAFLHELARPESPFVSAANRMAAFALPGADI